MASWYYYDQTGKKCGPVDSGTLRTLATHGIITPETTVLTEDGRGSLAEKVKGLEFPQRHSMPVSIPVPPPIATNSVSGSTPHAPHAPYASHTVNIATEPSPFSLQPQLQPQIITPQNSSVNNMLLGMEPNICFMLMHLTGFFFFPAAIVLWAMIKNKDVRADAHGKHIFNWLLSLLIYTIISCVLCLVLIGVIMLVALSVCSIAFSIIAAVKASKGELWKYPYSITFFRVDVISI
jgi:uncharacterized Tic20 family protein